MTTGYRALHAQLSSIMEALTAAAVAEICGLVEGGSAALRAEISRGRRENQELRRKLHLIESIIDRGRGGPEAGGGPTENLLPRTWSLRTQFWPQDPSPASSEDLRSAAAEETIRRGEVAPIKEETAKQEVKENDEELLLLQEDICQHAQSRGPRSEAEPQSSEDEDSLAGPSGTMAPTSDMRPWDRDGGGLAGLVRPAGRPGASDSPGREVTDGEASARRSFYVGSGDSPGTSPPRCGAISSAPYHPEPDLCPSWPGAAPASHRPYLNKVDKVSDPSGFPGAWVPGGARPDPLDRNRFCEDRRFVCSYCGKCFASTRSLETHVRVHTGERPYSCAQCGKRFTQSGHLKTHRSVHTGERPFACQLCGKRFAGKQNLRIHQHKHHPAVVH